MDALRQEEKDEEGWRKDKVCESDMLDPWSIILPSLIIHNYQSTQYTIYKKEYRNHASRDPRNLQNLENLNIVYHG